MFRTHEVGSEESRFGRFRSQRSVGADVEEISGVRFPMVLGRSRYAILHDFLSILSPPDEVALGIVGLGVPVAEIVGKVAR
jgi:hypothetical protein